jgi:hypothetical protein
VTNVQQSLSEMIELPDLETVASEVHCQWLESKQKMGIISRKAEDGEELMVPFEQLSEKAKELDRSTVRVVYAAIKRTVASCKCHDLT